MSNNLLLSRLGVNCPIILAPMLGISTPKLTAAVANAGGFAFHGAGQAPKEAVVKQIRDIKSILQPHAKFGVNFFVPAGFHLDPERWTQAQKTAVAEAAQRQAKAMTDMCTSDADVPSIPPATTLESLEAVFVGQLDALIEEGVKVASFIFGFPAAADVKRLQSAGIYLIGTATNVAEAQTLERLGADAIIAQGFESGGHRGTFLDANNYEKHSMFSTNCLLRKIKEVVSVPVIATGGIMDGADVAAALAAGASAAHLGTAFLTTSEAATTAPHRRHLLERNAETTVTKCFTGKPARGLVNKWAMDMDALQMQLPNCFNGMPAGRILQGVAMKAERPDVTYMWAGQGYKRCQPEMGAAALLAALVAETEAAQASSLGEEFQASTLSHQDSRL